jgi:hypothetical protein
MMLSPPRGRTLLAGFLLTCGACAHSEFPSAPEPSLEPAFQLSPGQASRVRPGEAGFFALAERIPGFGGYAFDAEGNLVAFIKGRTPGGDASAQVLLSRLLDRRRPALGRQGGVVVLRTADFSFAELAAWRDLLTDSLLGRGLDVRSTDVDEVVNRVRIGVGGSAGRAATLRVATEAGIPTAALAVGDEGLVEFEGEALTSLSSLTYADAPHANGLFYGGMQIRRWTGTEYKGCTLGFYATMAGVTVGVSNSHCSRDRDSNGGDGTIFTNSALSVLGSEAYDRNHYDWCPTLLSPFRYCRSADAMLFRTSSAFPAPAFRKIARYTVLNPGSNVVTTYQRIDANNPIVIGARTEARSGELVNKVGIATGWTQGVVTATCKDVEMWTVPIGGGPIYRCQHEASYGRADGDSGGPVFSFYYGTADLKGIHLGRVLQTTGMKTVFSPLSGIERDFGALGELPFGGTVYTPPAAGCDPLTAIVPC